MLSIAVINSEYLMGSGKASFGTLAGFMVFSTKEKEILPHSIILHLPSQFLQEVLALLLSAVYSYIYWSMNLNLILHLVYPIKGYLSHIFFIKYY